MTIHELIAAVKVERLQYKRFIESQQQLKESIKRAKHWEIDKMKEEVAMLGLGIEGQGVLVEALQDMINEHEDYRPKA